MHVASRGPDGTRPQTATRSTIVSVRGVSKAFRRRDGGHAPAVDNVDLEVTAGEFLVLLGPSGCGKTTLLRLVAGLEEPDSGSIEIAGSTVFSSERRVNVAPERRRLSMVFQTYALWPHMTARDNVSYPLASRRRVGSRTEVARQVQAMLSAVGIAELADRYPNQMSGGQQQRVALGRALVAGNELVLFDEPLSSVDAKVREQLRVELLSMQARFGFSAVFVTHDQLEAMALADRVVVMRDGRIVQSGPPRQIYEQPATRYVANFVGVSNDLPGTVTEIGNGVATVATELGPVVGSVPNRAVRVGDRVAAVCRPEKCWLGGDRPDLANQWRGTVEARSFLGPHAEYFVRVGERMIRVWSTDLGLARPSEEVWTGVADQDVRILADE